MTQTLTEDPAIISICITAEDESLIPSYTTEGAAGADIRAAIKETVSLRSGCSKLIPTGLRCAIPPGYEIQVRPRSGLALKNQITVLNTPGTIDADYRGEIGVILINHGTEEFLIEPGMRIAQIVVAPVMQAAFQRVEELPSTSRGTGGFGHTGI
jgi:dUTP pyrophosphatase